MPELSRADWVREAARTLAEAAVDSPRLSAELILRHVCGISRVELATRPETPLTADQLSRMNGLLRRRAEGEPVSYLLGQREFYGRDFRVTPATLIPRPETELLIERALKSCQGPVRFADLGTGSGCIAVTLCAERPEWRGIMADLSGRALAVACQNAARHKVRERLLPVRADFTRPLLRPTSLDLLVSNPPYVGQSEYEGLSAEVRDFEPVTALVPGFVDSDKVPGHGHHHHHGHILRPGAEPEGLEHLEAVAQEAFTALKPGGLLLMEHGWKQGPALKVLLESHRWEKVLILQDLAGLDRLVSARKPASCEPHCCTKDTIAFVSQ